MLKTVAHFAMATCTIQNVFFSLMQCYQLRDWFGESCSEMTGRLLANINRGAVRILLKGWLKLWKQKP